MSKTLQGNKKGRREKLVWIQTQNNCKSRPACLKIRKEKTQTNELRRSARRASRLSSSDARATLCSPLRHSPLLSCVLPRGFLSKKWMLAFYYKRHQCSHTWTPTGLIRRNNYWSKSQKSLNLVFRFAFLPLFKWTSLGTTRRFVWAKTSLHQTMKENFFRLDSVETKRTQNQTLNRWQGVVVTKGVVFSAPANMKLTQLIK